MLKERETVLRRFFLFVDCVIISLAFFLAFLLKGMLHEPGEPLKRYVVTLLIAIPLWCLTLYANGIYLSMRTRSYLEILWAIIKSAVLTFLAMGTFIYLLKLTQMSRLFFTL